MVARITTGTTGASVSRVKPRLSVTVINPTTSVSRVVPASEISYVYLVLSAQLDSSGRYQYKSDMTVAVDSTAFAFFKRLEETQGYAIDYFAEDYTIAPTNVGVFDAVSMQADKGSVDSVSITDVCIPVLVFLRTFSDTVSFLDASSVNFSRGLVEAISEFDALAISVFGVYTDTTVLADNQAITFSQVRTDSVGATEAIGLTVSLNKADSFLPADAGAINVQSYAVADYFAADYVGANYTF